MAFLNSNENCKDMPLHQLEGLDLYLPIGVEQWIYSSLPFETLKFSLAKGFLHG
jgi:hypothetical protein